MANFLFSPVHDFRYSPYCLFSLASYDFVTQDEKNISWNRWSKYIDGLGQDCSNSSALAKQLLQYCSKPLIHHYNDVIMNTMASRITSLTIVYWSIYSATDQRKYQSSASLVFVRGIHRRPVNSPHKGPVTRKMSPFDDFIIVSITMYACAPLNRDHG